MGKIRTAAAVVWAFALVAGAAHAEENWIRISAGHDKFHFLAPAQPTLETENGVEDGTKYESNTYTIEAAGFTEVASFTEYKTSTVKISLPILTTSMIKAFDGQLVSNQTLPYERGPKDSLFGAMITLKKNSVTCRFRVVIEDVRAHSLGVCVPDGADTKDADKALASLEITK